MGAALMLHAPWPKRSNLRTTTQDAQPLLRKNRPSTLHLFATACPTSTACPFHPACAREARDTTKTASLGPCIDLYLACPSNRATWIASPGAGLHSPPLPPHALHPHSPQRSRKRPLGKQAGNMQPNTPKNTLGNWLCLRARCAQWLLGACARAPAPGTATPQGHVH